MDTFKIEIKETLSRIITIEATSIDEAISKASELYHNEEIILDAEDYNNTEFLEFSDELTLD